MESIIHVKSYAVYFKAQADTILPSSHGSMIRGVLGNILRDQLCSRKENIPCESCSRKVECLYTKLFYGLSQLMTQSTIQVLKIPNPFVIKPLSQGITRYQQGDTFKFEITLIGDKIHQYTPYYLMAIKEIENRGLGIHKGRFQLVHIVDTVQKKRVDLSQLLSICNDTSILIRSPKDNHTGTCEIFFKTPFRLVKDGKITSDFEFVDFIKSIMRRGTLMQVHYEYSESQAYHVEDAIAEAAQIQTIKKNIKWSKLEKVSVHKKQKMSLSGTVGSIVYKGDFKKVIYWLELAKWIHVGKACTTGDGWIEYTLKE